MNHSWVKEKTPSEGFKETHICKMCGCKRDMFLIKINDFYKKEFIYSRSKMIFGDTRPDCIDWELENSKTID